jgi:hypothetical protein
MFIQRMTPSLLRATALVSALAIVACSSDPTDPGGGGGGTGSFDATVTGDVSATFSGAAVQGEADIETGQSGWIAILGSTSLSGNSVLIACFCSRPANGTYSLIDLNTAGDLVDGEWALLLTLGDGTTPTFLGFATGPPGTVTITSSSADLVVGTYNAPVSGIDPSNPQALTVANVTGSFSAVGGPVNLPEIP